MKTKTILSLFFLLLFFTCFKSAAQKADMTGEWQLNKEKSTLGDGQMFLSKITLKFKADSLLTTRVYENANGEEYPFDEKLSLDGKDNKIVIYDMPRMSSAADSSNSIKIASTTTFNGNNGMQDMIAKEIWKLDSDGKTLILEFTNKMGDNETIKGTYYFDKVK